MDMWKHEINELYYFGKFSHLMMHSFLMNLYNTNKNITKQNSCSNSVQILYIDSNSNISFYPSLYIVFLSFPGQLACVTIRCFPVLGFALYSLFDAIHFQDGFYTSAICVFNTHLPAAHQLILCHRPIAGKNSCLISNVCLLP